MAVELRGVAHVNVNCSNLARSSEFFREVLELDVVAHTCPKEPQDGSLFGLPGKARWDAHMLCDARGFSAPAIDLLEWLEPRPIGAPHAEPHHLGFYRICFLAADLDARYEALRARGVECLSEPLDVPLGSAVADSVRALCFRDPDGTVLELIERPESSVQAAHVNINCSDIALSHEWYERVLGLKTLGSSAPGPVPGTLFGMPGDIEWDARFLLPPEGGQLAVDLLEWKHPTPVGSPSARANQLGIFRMAFLVDDAHEAHAELLRQGVDAPPPVFLDMGPEIPVDGVWAVFFRDPDGTCLELIQSPV
ncbi:MAG: VOC family protein [Deltaproteobacteria bacterium]|nr:VOC family protein [Deltaproteobacteria bacterium]MBW2359390.1 VOC family protein [Deltaproteobacteria bacterium]